MRHRWISALRRCLLRATALSLACSFVVPAGYMPAALADGGPFALCGFELKIAGGMSHGAHHDHHADDATQSDTETGSSKDELEYCPLGALSAASALTADFFPFIEYRKQFVQTDVGFQTFVQRTTVGFLSRAPPAANSKKFLT
jgi:hypothetical protein